MNQSSASYNLLNLYMAMRTIQRASVKATGVNISRYRDPGMLPNCPKTSKHL